MLTVKDFLTALQSRVEYIVGVYDEKCEELGRDEANEVFEQGCAAAIVAADLASDDSLNIQANVLSHRTAMELAAFYLDLRRAGVKEIVIVKYSHDDIEDAF